MSESDTSDSVSEDLQPITMRKRRSTASTPGPRRTSTRKPVSTSKSETQRTPRVALYNVTNELPSTPLTTQSQASTKQSEHPKPAVEAVEEKKKPEPVVEKPVQSPILPKKSTNEQTKSDVSFSPKMNQTSQPSQEPVPQKPEVPTIPDERTFGIASYIRYYLRFLTWTSFMAAFGVASLIIFVDIHLLSKNSKRRTSFVNVVLSILLISFLSMIARDNITPVPLVGQPGTYTPQGPIVVPQLEIEKILKRVDEKYNPKFDSLNQNFAEFKRTLDQYQDAQTKIKNEIKSMEALISAGADPSKVDISQYLNQLRELEQRLSKMIDNQIEAVQKRNLELANRQTQLDSKFDKEKQEFDAKIQELLGGISHSTDSVSNVESSLKNEIDKVLKQLSNKQVPEEVVREWANDVFNSEKTKLIAEVLKSVQNLMDEKISNIKIETSAVEPKTVSTPKEDILQLIESRLERFLADKIARADFALASAGGRILQHSTSPAFSAANWWPLSFLGARQAVSAPASVVIQQDNSIGNCYAFAGQQGYITIQLAMPIIPSAFTLDHISSEIAFNSTSTPKDFKVIGYRNVTDPQPISFGPFTYQLGKEHKQIQTFEIPEDQKTTQAISYVTLDIKSNYGNQDYTCVYRFRVHGTPSK